MMRDHPMTLDDIARRYPLLIRAMRWAAILTDGEAVSAIHLHQMGDRYAGEAVNHFGGIPAVFETALRCRHFVRTISHKAKTDSKCQNSPPKPRTPKPKSRKPSTICVSPAT
jgi:hypothetical protein